MEVSTKMTHILNTYFEYELVVNLKVTSTRIYTEFTHRSVIYEFHRENIPHSQEIFLQTKSCKQSL